ncbi:PDR/VanB family oxidoreductase [Frankia sp. AgKG'84/4]|uniref:PDR/VanB family oxidoreductase n=1 Tax=Frankia sp. AgKG'84/4 TaxID=573490 RepID=UPI00200E1285|nr:PDR/VanB family oxidoreductase [Frankia sp. AgKG'84/4]MCL9794497.1 PDR/VanB family oxidoreductase [Frankia sp. AgKG'84/4]
MNQEADLRLTVHRRWAGADGVVLLDLRDPAGAELPRWSPGAHVDLMLPGGLTRQYSLCGEPAQRHAWRLGVLREPAGRGGSAYVHDHLPQGATVEVRGPRNHFALVPAARYLFLAGGIGITPILAMTSAAARAGADWELHYGGRSRASMAFLDELGAAGDRISLYPQDEVGLIDLDRLLATPRPDTAVYCCGPEPLLAAVERRCAGWPPGSLHVERFTPRDVGPPVRTGSFEVTLAASGRTLTVPPDRSILDVVEAAGVSVLSSCQEGTCGTCETAVLAGEVDHRDSLLTPDERAANDTIFLCVSRAACPRLVLDL